jgi:hypothetical protein
LRPLQVETGFDAGEIREYERERLRMPDLDNVLAVISNQGVRLVRLELGRVLGECRLELRK